MYKPPNAVGSPYVTNCLCVIGCPPLPLQFRNRFVARRISWPQSAASSGGGGLPSQMGFKWSVRLMNNDWNCLWRGHPVQPTQIGGGGGGHDPQRHERRRVNTPSTTTNAVVRVDCIRAGRGTASGTGPYSTQLSTSGADGNRFTKRHWTGTQLQFTFGTASRAHAPLHRQPPPPPRSALEATRAGPGRPAVPIGTEMRNVRYPRFAGSAPRERQGPHSAADNDGRPSAVVDGPSPVLTGQPPAVRRPSIGGR